MHVVILDDQYGPLFRDVSEFLGPWISGCDLVFACVGIFISIILIRYYKSLLHSFTAAISIAAQGVLQPFGRFGTAIFVVLIMFFVVLFCCNLFLLPVLFCTLVLLATAPLLLQSGDKQTGHGLFIIRTWDLSMCGFGAIECHNHKNAQRQVWSHKMLLTGPASQFPSMWYPVPQSSHLLSPPSLGSNQSNPNPGPRFAWRSPM